MFKIQSLQTSNETFGMFSCPKDLLNLSRKLYLPFEAPLSLFPFRLWEHI